MMSHNFLRLVLLGNAHNIARLGNLLRRGIRATRLGLALALAAAALTTAAAAQLASTPPSPNAPSVYTGDTVIFTVTT